MSQLAHPRRTPWVIALVAAIVIPVLTFAGQQGRCFDAAAGAGESVCSSGPAVGWAGAWVITALCGMLVVVSIVHLLRRHPS